VNIYTSYYANKRLKKDGIHTIAISIRIPPWYKGDCLTELAPKYSWLLLERSEYIQNYNKKLSGLSAEDILNQIKDLSGGKDVALLCWESPGKFCHRQLVAKWLHENLGIQVNEYRVILG
jgi:uncharacterized protein (DUF488 family)